MNARRGKGKGVPSVVPPPAFSGEGETALPHDLAPGLSLPE